MLRDPPAAQILPHQSNGTDYPKDGQIIHKRLLVDIPTAPQSLDTDRIALIRDRTRFDYYADLGVDRPGSHAPASTLLVEAFENEGSIPAVGRGAETLTPDYLLKTEIREFEARYDQEQSAAKDAVVALDLQPGEKCRIVQMIGRTLITESTPAARNSVDSVVEAFDAAVGKILVRSTVWTMRLMRPAAHSTRPEQPLAYRFTRQVKASYST